MCQKQEEHNLHQSGLLFRQIPALRLLHPLIFMLFLLSVLSLCWEFSPFSWVIHRHGGLPQRTPINHNVLHRTHAEPEHAHICSMHMHTPCLISHHTLAHISWLSMKSQDFPPQLFWSNIIILSVKDSSSLISPFIRFISLLRPSWLYLFQLYAALLFPRQQWQRTLPRRI